MGDRPGRSSGARRDERAVSRPQSFLSVLTGSFSTPAAGNPTVAMVEAAYRHHGLDARYINCDVAPGGLADAVRGARAMGWAGFNCSTPHKVAVLQHLDRVAASAELIGAVNCVVRREDELIGENTDGQGFLASLRTVIDPAGEALVLFGAGGAARAIAVEMALAGVSSITVVNRDRNRGAELVRLIEDRTDAFAELVPWTQSYRVPPHASIVVNATSVGLFPDVESRLDLETTSLLPEMVVADVIPNPPRTAFLRAAQSRGCRTLDGTGMLVNQAIIGIEHWIGVGAEAAVMRQVLDELFGP
jgi:shikimate dehydrogenase